MGSIATRRRKAVRPDREWVLASELIVDYDLYPRPAVIDYNVGRMVEFLASGGELPAVIVDRKSKRIADGVHRYKAYLRWAFVQGGEPGMTAAKVLVQWRDFADEAALFAFAAEVNDIHGLALDSQARTRVVIIAQRLGIADEEVARILHMRVEKISAIREQKTAIVGGQIVGLKRTVQRQLAGRKLTPRQAEANRKCSGMQPTYYVNQLVNLLDNDLVARDDEHLKKELKKLADAIKRFLK